MPPAEAPPGSRRRVAVVGAGPFGQSVAAHLAGADVVLYGEPMATWLRMPPGMTLRSSWRDTSLSAPGGRGTLDEWADVTGAPRREPIVLETFLEYARWFGERYVGAEWTDDAVSVERSDRVFVVRSSSLAREVDAVVVAVGVRPFVFYPDPFRSLPPRHLVHASELAGATFAGATVLIVGGGQGAIESAAVAVDGGAASVELVARGRVHWFADREHGKARGRVGSVLYELAYPVVGYGPPPLNRLVTHPDLFAALPWRLRRRITRRLLRPGGSESFRRRLAERLVITERRHVVHATGAGPVELVLDDGTRREVDVVVLGTGYRFDLERLSFLDPGLRADIRTDHGWPALDRSFQSSVPNLFLVGFAAEGRFGPVSRFVLGAGFAARRVAGALA